MSTQKERFAFHLDRGLKHKLNILAEADDMKLGGFINHKLEELVRDFENKILEVYGEEDFISHYVEIFGAEFDPIIQHRPTKATVTTDQVKHAIRTILNGHKKLESEQQKGK